MKRMGTVEEVVKVQNVFFRYDKEYVLEDIGLDVFQGDYLGIVGPNGSAKTTLLRLMLGLLKPEKGLIQLFGQDVSSFRRWNRIGYVPQQVKDFNFSFPASVEEVVAANLYSQIGLFRPIQKKHMEMVHETLKAVGLEKCSKKLIGNLSGGQQRRVFIARALVNHPDIIFLDEPTVGIDAKSQEEFYQLLKKLNEERGITIVIISHDIGAMMKNASRIVCMGEKKLIPYEKNSALFRELPHRFMEMK